jgi:hypothetical protein
MKKFLSVFIALAMVFSLFAGVGTHSAKAALANGLRDLDPVTNASTYTMGEVITGVSTQAAATSVYLIKNDATPFTAVDSYAVAGAGQPFVLRTSDSTLLEGKYWVVETTQAAGLATVPNANIIAAGDAAIYLKYNVAGVTPATLAVSTTPVLFSGRLFHGDTAQTPAGSATTVGLYLNGTGPAVASSTLIDGWFSFYYTVAAYGTYTLQVTDSPAYLPDGTTPAVGPVNPAPYAKWTVTPGALQLSKMVEPTLLYKNILSYIYLKVTDASGVAVSGLHAGDFGFAPSYGSITVNELVAGSGLYEIKFTPNGVGTTNLTVTYGTTGATGKMSFNIMDTNPIWNPTVSFTLGAPALAIGGTAAFTGNYNVWTGYALHDSLTSVTGPTTSSNVIWTGGQFVVTMNANVWKSTDTALTAKPIYGTQVFKISPAVTGDVVTIDPTTINVGDTKDITVTVLQASGIERNNGYVLLDGVVGGMFTAPTGSAYVVDSTGRYAYYDAINANKNIVGGKYVFAGLKINHAGSIMVYTLSGLPGGPYDLTSIGKITVGKRIHTLTADVAKFVSGVAYPVVNVTGGVTGLTFTASSGSLGIIDNGDGSYIFNVPAVADVASITYTGTIPTLPDDQYILTMPVVRPTLTLTSVHKDGLITDSWAETVTFTLTDPVTGADLAFTSPQLAVQYTTWAINGDPNLAVSSLAGGLGNVSTTLAVASTGNPNLDYTTVKPMVSIVMQVNGVWIHYTNMLKVTDPTITYTIGGKSDLVMYYNVQNMFTISAKDAHGLPQAGQAISGVNPYNSSLGYLFGGLTGVDGTASFSYAPNYMGQIDISSGIGGTITVQIVAAPVDTTAPVITIDAGIDGTTVTSDTLTLSGKVNEKVTALYVGMNKVDVLPDGTFATNVKLASGANTIAVTAFDLAGNKGAAAVKVTYTPAASAKVIMLTIGTDIVTVNGKATSIPAVPEIVNGHTFVPIRFVAETFGATVDWLAETQGITITLGDSTIGLQIGNATAVINGSIVSLEAAPYIKNGSTMVPLRVISEAFGGDVAWDAATRTITISYMP